MSAANTKKVANGPFVSLKADLEKFIQENGREQLIKIARLSTATLQQIRNERFPWKENPKDSDERQKRAWARTFTRIAIVLRHSPQNWCEATGLELTRAVTTAIERQRATFATEASDDHSDILDRIRARANVEPTVHVAVLKYGLFSEGLGSRESFLEQLADKFVGTLDAQSKLDPSEQDDLDHLIEQLGSDNHQFDFVMGLFDTVSRRLKKIDFIPIPGWSIDLAGLYFKPLGNSSERTWASFLNPNTYGESLALVIQGEAGQIFLRGTHRFPKENLKSDAYSRNFEDVAKWVELTAREHSELNSVFVADEFTVVQVMRYLNLGIRVKERGSVATLLNREEMPLPSYPLSLAFREAKPASRALIENAFIRELFSNDCYAMATLYAEVAFKSLADLPPQLDERLSIWAPEFFHVGNQKTTKFFWSRFISHFKSLADTRKDELAGKKAHLALLEEIHEQLTANQIS